MCRTCFSSSLHLVGVVNHTSVLKNDPVQKLGCDCWGSDVRDSNNFSQSGEVFYYSQDILVVVGGFGKRSHEIPSDELERQCDGDGLERSGGLARGFDVLTQSTLVDVDRDRVSHVGPIILEA